MKTEIYNQLKTVPRERLKVIGAGRLKGMFDISPQWRIEKLTETFGACGFGWATQNVTFTYQTKGDEVVVNCHLEMIVKHNEEWSKPIFATGGSKFSTTETKGVYVSDEAEKMAYTDAIGVAGKMLGLAADVYMGEMDKTKYTNEPAAQQTSEPTQTDDRQWLNLIGRDGKPASAYYQIKDRIDAGEEITLASIMKKRKVSKVEQERLRTDFNIT
jgi:hypothetical protein